MRHAAASMARIRPLYGTSSKRIFLLLAALSEEEEYGELPYNDDEEMILRSLLICWWCSKIFSSITYGITSCRLGWIPLHIEWGNIIDKLSYRNAWRYILKHCLPHEDGCLLSIALVIREQVLSCQRCLDLECRTGSRSAIIHMYPRMSIYIHDRGLS